MNALRRRQHVQLLIVNLIRMMAMPYPAPERRRRVPQRRPARRPRRTFAPRPVCAIARTAITSAGSNSSATSYTTAGSFTPASNELLTAFVFNYKATTPDAVNSITAFGLTWTQDSTKTQSNGTNITQRVSLWYAWSGSSPTTTQMTFDFNGATQTGIRWIVSSWSGTAASATGNGSGGFGQTSVTNGATSGTAVTATLAALQSSGSVAHYGVMCETTGTTITDNNSFTAITGGNVTSTPTGRADAFFKVNATACAATLGTSQAWATIAIELKAAAGGGGLLVGGNVLAGDNPLTKGVLVHA